MKLSFQEHHLFQILRRFDNQHLPLDLFLGHYFRANKALGSKDRRFIAEAIYDMMRWRGLIDFLIGKESNWESRYSLYKGFQPQNYLSVSDIPLHTRVSFPKELFDLLKNHYGEEKAIHLCQISNTQAPLTVRINPMKTTRDELLSRWKEHHQVSLTEKSPYGITFKKRIPFFEMVEFQEGLFEVQDEGSQLAATLVHPKAGDHVLDYCSGSGGKTLAFAHLLEGKGQIYLHDIRPAALEQAKKRLKRAGIQNAQMLETNHPSWNRLRGKMDWVVVDAPCSGSGTLRRNPEMKWKFRVENLHHLVNEQREIVSKALPYLKEGGRLVYITCSLFKEENEEQVEYFLKTHDLQSVADPFVSLPSFGGPDGFYAITFIKRVA